MLKHAWFSGKRHSKRESIKITDKEKMKIQAIDMFLKDMEFPKGYIDQTLSKNLFNHLKAC